MAERRRLAREKRQREQEAAKLAKEKAAEEKRQRAKELRKTTKAKDSSFRRQNTMIGNLIHCHYCHDMIDQMEFDDHKVSHPSRIRSRIWLGNAENSKDITFIEQYNITHILNCTKEIELTKQIKKKIKSFKRISIQDKNHETILDYINESNAFIEKALGQNKSNAVFVHCREGRSRSVSFLSAYLMWKEEDSFHAILADITSKRHIVLPNNKFYSELEKYDKLIILDRKNNRKKFGKPNGKFKLETVGKNKRNMNDMKSNEEESKQHNMEVDDSKTASSQHKGTLRRRRSSLGDIDLSLVINRNNIKLTAGFSGRISSQKKSNKLTKKKTSKQKKKSRNNDNKIDSSKVNKDLKQWMVKHSVWDDELYSYLILNGVLSRKDIIGLNQNKFDRILRQFRVEQFAKVKNKKSRNRIDKILIKFEKSWKKIKKKKKKKK
eukprot:299024_1